MKRILITIIVIAAATLPGLPAEASTLATPWIREAVALVNEERVSHGLPELSVNETLSAAAALKLADMEKKGYFAHTSPEKRTPWSFFDEAGYSYRYAGENLSIHFKTPEAEHDAWMESETHCQNILDPRFLEIGMAVRKVFMEGRETVLTVQLFGTESGRGPVGGPGKEAAIAMCRGEETPAVSGASSDRIGDIGAALLSSDVTGRFGAVAAEWLDSYRMTELLAVLGFSVAQILTVLVAMQVLLDKEYEEGIYPS